MRTSSGWRAGTAPRRSSPRSLLATTSPTSSCPRGRRNHFALDLGLDRDDVVGALDAFVDGVERRVDLASVNGRIFVNNATLGLYAKIVQSPEYRDAKRETTAAMLPELLGPGRTRTGPAVRRSRRCGARRPPTSSSSPTTRTSSTASPGRGTRESLDRGLLGIATVAIDDARAAAQLVSLELAGQVQRFKGWLEWTAQRFEVGADEPVEVGVDGEALRMDPPLVFESLPGALRVRLPRTAGGRSPAARAVHLASRSTVVTLGQIAGGHDPSSAPTRR